MNIPYFAFYPHDWLSDSKVQHLTHEERGVYVDLLCHMWVMAGEHGDCSLPDDPTFICRLLKIRPAKWKKLRAVLVEGVAPVIYSQNGRLINPRLLKEFEIAKEKSQKAARAAKERWDSERDREQNEGGIPSPTAPEKPRDESPQPASQGHVDDANALRSQCYSDTDTDTDTDTDLKDSATDVAGGGAAKPPAPEKPKPAKPSQPKEPKRQREPNELADVTQLQQHWRQTYESRYDGKSPPENYGHMGRAFKDFLRTATVDELRKAIDVYFSCHDPFLVGHPFGIFQRQIARWLAIARGQAPHPNQRVAPIKEPAKRETAIHRHLRNLGVIS